MPLSLLTPAMPSTRSINISIYSLMSLWLFTRITLNLMQRKTSSSSTIFLLVKDLLWSQTLKTTWFLRLTTPMSILSPSANGRMPSESGRTSSMMSLSTQPSLLPEVSKLLLNSRFNLHSLLPSKSLSKLVSTMKLLRLRNLRNR